VLTHDYTVRLDQFEGPLDLLLHLIRRAELDVTAISVASITDQYLHHLEQIDRVDVDVAGEFLVMAATLLEVKSRLVSPAPPDGDDQTAAETTAQTLAALDEAPGNPAAELIRQLLAYKAFRDAADALEARRTEWSARYPVGGAVTDPEAMERFAPADELDLEDLGLYDLVEAFQRIIETVQFDRLGAHSVAYDDTPIELHAEDILDTLRREAAGGSGEGGSGGTGGVSLRRMFSGRSRSEMIGLFLATLELVRQRRVTIKVDEEAGQIMLEAAQPEPTPGVSPAEPASPVA